MVDAQLLGLDIHRGRVLLVYMSGATSSMSHSIANGTFIDLVSGFFWLGSLRGDPMECVLYL